MLLLILKWLPAENSPTKRVLNVNDKKKKKSLPTENKKLYFYIPKKKKLYSRLQFTVIPVTYGFIIFHEIDRTNTLFQV